MIWMIPALGAAVLAQSTVLSTWFPQRIVPDLALILVALCGGLRGWRPGLFSGLLGGLMMSGVSVAPIGVHLVRLAVVGAGAGLAGARFGRGGPLVAPVLVALATVAAAVFGTVGLQAAGWRVAVTGPAAAEFAGQALLNALVALPLLPLLRRMLLGSAQGREEAVG